MLLKYSEYALMTTFFISLEAACNGTEEINAYRKLELQCAVVLQGGGVCEADISQARW